MVLVSHRTSSLVEVMDSRKRSRRGGQVEESDRDSRKRKTIQTLRSDSRRWRFYRMATPGGHPGSIDNFCTLNSTKKSINTFTKEKFGQSENFHTQIGLGILFSTLLTGSYILF
uniref:Uncharacterized protein n=1 Tax=Medicago truncatula TaxID=3880 RepID=Q1S5H8_MEDTR|nr:hypothetical protein MtrDRAFT_AC147431g1v2 [Medicago truncatula]